MPDYEIYYYFIALGQELLKDNGYLAYIIPNTWLFNVNAKEYRKDIFKKWSIVELLDCTNFQIFEAATVRNSVITLQKSANQQNNIGYRNTRNLSDETEGKKSSGKDYFTELTRRKRLVVDKSELIDNFSQNWGLALYLTKQEKGIVSKINSLPRRLNEFFDVSQGYIPYRLKDLEKNFGKEEAKIIKEEQRWHSDTKLNDSYELEIKGENITKYKCTPSNVYVKYGKHVGTYVDMKYFSSPRLLVREIINPLMACYAEDTYINDPGIIDVIKNEDNNVYSFKTLWGILNSRLATFFLLRFAPKASKGTFPKVLITDINNFPLPEIDDENNKYFSEIETCYDRIFAKDREPDSDKMFVKENEWQIDYWVFKLYGITSEEDIDLVYPDFYKLKPADFDIE